MLEFGQSQGFLVVNIVVVRASNSELVLLACLLEATAHKPGNVHPDASFADLSYADFARSARLMAAAFETCTDRSVGRLVFDAVEATQRAVGRNTNLGIALLLAPMTCVPAGIPIIAGIESVLAQINRDDAELVYAAIRLANPGGLGRVDREDVHSAPSVTLLEAMRLAADRDRIAAQYADGFSTVLAGARKLAAGKNFPSRWEEAVIDLHLWLMAEFPDTLIARKCGGETARESSQRAQMALEAGGTETEAGRQKLKTLDAWLREDGNRRNPGTSADLVAGCLFAALRDLDVEPPPIPECARPFLKPEPLK